MTFELGPNQKKWIAALRANPDQQIKGRLGLRKGKEGKEGFCCLGKGAEILGLGLWEERKNGVYQFFVENNTGVLEIPAYEALGLRSGDGLFKKAILINGLTIVSLAMLNDDVPGFTWTDIADYIEENPENVFVKSK
jgi:hypothetical protein